MSRKKIILLLISVVAVVAFTLLLISISSRGSKTSTENDPANYNEAVSVDEREPLVKSNLIEGKIFISDRERNPYVLNASFNQTDVTELDKGFFQLFKAEDPESESFDIFYDEPSGSITVFLYKEPLRDGQYKVTDLLLKKLNTSKDIICTLDISVITNEYVNKTYAGVDLGLSVCPGHIEL
jgi:hypothetical protein